ncbi:hypothetical protein CVV65_08495 [Kyrpidia spormannii]|uniref:Uncharacterized protein n=1 Tax=Kyrpidia spormannii TaxID=2055160 RepID=A0A2K8N809_9BACL|nr:hypothetical protein CVV65_08495 [Kyrpidia spormannii]
MVERLGQRERLKESAGTFPDETKNRPFLRIGANGRFFVNIGSVGNIEAAVALYIEGVTTRDHPSR